MQRIADVLPNHEVLLGLAPEELAYQILGMMLRSKEPMFHFAQLGADEYRSDGPTYPRQSEAQISLALREAWAWLTGQGLLIPVEGSNGGNGWHHLSRRAGELTTVERFESFKLARILPKEALHQVIQDKVWMAMMRGEFDVAVFQAMKMVEVRIRDKSGINNEVGVKLARLAFKAGGPLADPSVDPGEQVGRMELFAGALGSFKNSHSHRDVDLSNPLEALEVIYFANHLLRILDRVP